MDLAGPDFNSFEMDTDISNNFSWTKVQKKSLDL